MLEDGQLQALGREHEASTREFDAWAAAPSSTRVESALDAWVPADAPGRPRRGDALRACSTAASGCGRCWCSPPARPSTATRAAALRAACAVELIHAYSLVHDDMPCMDNDVLRRGKPTVHVQFGEAQAMLAGDALQALAFEVLTPDDGGVAAGAAGAPVRPAGARRRRTPAWPAARRSTWPASACRSTSAQLRDMHRCKTGALLQASVLMGAACGDARAARAGGARRDYGDAIGLAFQVVDDILDVDRRLGDARQDRRQGRDAQQADLCDRCSACDAAQRYAEELRARGARRARRAAALADARRLRELADHGRASATTDPMNRMTPARNDRRPGRPAPAVARRSCTQLADELRAFVLETVSQTGGHLSSNLGTVELTIALHYVFNTPHDRLVWDVGHQTYPHKILTGRRERMRTLRQLGGISGFPRRERKRVRHLRHRAFVDLDLGRARHGAWRRKHQGRERARRWRSSATAR